ncbi:amylo-alpha-1,6-glucosidase [Winogradskyella alexanderae]|uniref:Glycoside hydrolase n=1 Tax=Winogradskyella alexanderae TaxID=2877123 RepID=A0ABS7XNE2_9FLAO|nr:trehalase family glycosidase [Winogradskyella alexanderae]MCA0131525.1 glycoside hydrolase [Winogradskyella alexanderae]
MDKQNLIKGAKAVLNSNFNEDKGFTIPCEGLYPFQWHWDSGFIAIGYAHYDMEKAKREIESLLSGQWNNGFIPHIVFHNHSDTYFPGPDYHRSDLHPAAPKDIKTTGITQPPVLGFVLKEIYEIAQDKTEILEFIKRNIDKVYKNHQYFYTHRDPYNEGLVYIYHNWESGTDNSPIWDEIWQTMDPPKYKYERKDTTHVDASQRPTNSEYDCYLHLLEIAKAHNYSDKKIAELSPFLVQDPLFNAILIKSTEALIELYEIISGHSEKIESLKNWLEKAKKRFEEKLFDIHSNSYVYYDLRNQKHIVHTTSSSFTPLFAGIPNQERANQLVKQLETVFGSDNLFLCASFDPTSKHYSPMKYWRGPIWINLNWLIYKGLKRYGYFDLARRIKAETINFIEKHGFYEYFDARKQKFETAAYGGNNFSWSAALILDLIKE